MGYLKDTIKGIAWVGIFRVSSRIVAFARIAIIARVLLPAQFGIFGVAGLVLTLLETLTITGINVFLVQEKENIDLYIDTAWVISIIRGTLIAILILLITPLIINFFHIPEARNVLLLMSIVPFLRGFINPSIVKFQRELQFKKEFWFKFPIYLIESAVLIVLAIVTRSAVSFVWGMIAGVFFEIVLSFLFTAPRPKLSFDKIKMKKIINRGKWVTAFGVFDYLFQNTDDLVVGKILSKSSLGIYQVAYKISSLPITEIAHVFSRVTFPVYRKISEDKDRLKRALLKTTLGVSALVIPFGTIIFIFAEQIVYILLGPNWTTAVPVLRILSLYGIIRGIFYPMLSVFLALQKQRYVSVVTLTGFLGLGISIIPLVNRFGIIGAGVSTVIGSLLTVPVVMYYLTKTFKRVS